MRWIEECKIINNDVELLDCVGNPANRNSLSIGQVLGVWELPGRAASVQPARRSVADVLRKVGWSDSGNAELLTSELVSNAIKHSESGRQPDGRVIVVVIDCGGSCRIEVFDGGSSSSVPQAATEFDLVGESGRGLWLVRETALEWGWRTSGAGRVVWFRTEKDGSPA